MIAAVLFVAAFFPVYLLLREPFRKLPLHIDTGFYVSNATLATGRWDFRRGWNAHSAGGSKLIPEAFFSRLYLLGRRGSDAGTAARRYLSWSRCGTSVVNYVSCVLTGVLAMTLADFDVRLFYAGLICHAFLSSEPHYGGGFECAEVFEVPFQLLSVIAFAIGVKSEAPDLVALAAFSFAFEACFVKLSAAVSWTVFFGAGIALAPWTAVPVLAGGGAATLMFAGWLVYVGRSPAQWFVPLRGHEASFAKRGSGVRYGHRLHEKGGRFVRTVLRQPVIPLLAAASAFLNATPDSLIILYLLAALAAYAAQNTDCRYYLLPVLPPIAVCAAGSVVALVDKGAAGIGVGVVAALVWLIGTPVRAAFMNPLRRNRWVWSGSLSSARADENAVLAEYCEGVRTIVSGRSLLVYGPHNQAGVLIGSGWPTPIVAPEHYLDDMHPGWQAELNEKMLADPPAFILDTGRCFDVKAAHVGLGLGYQVAAQQTGFRLYQLASREEPGGAVAKVRTWRPLSEAEWARSGPRETNQDGTAGSQDGRTHDFEDQVVLHRLLTSLAAGGCRGIGVYGAGRFTIRMADVYRASPVPVRVILDDEPRPDAQGRFLDWPVVEPSRVREFNVDAIVISTDRFSRAMRRRLRELGLSEIPSFPIDTRAASLPSLTTSCAR